MSSHVRQLPHSLRTLIRNNPRTIVALMAVVVFLWLMQEVLEGELTQLDSAAYQLVVVHMRREWLTPVMQSISELALPVVLVVMLLVRPAGFFGKSVGDKI